MHVRSRGQEAGTLLASMPDTTTKHSLTRQSINFIAAHANQVTTKSLNRFFNAGLHPITSRYHDSLHSNALYSLQPTGFDTCFTVIEALSPYYAAYLMINRVEATNRKLSGEYESMTNLMKDTRDLCKKVNLGMSPLHLHLPYRQSMASDIGPGGSNTQAKEMLHQSR